MWIAGAATTSCPAATLADAAPARVALRRAIVVNGPMSWTDRVTAAALGRFDRGRVIAFQRTRIVWPGCHGRETTLALQHVKVTRAGFMELGVLVAVQPVRTALIVKKATTVARRCSTACFLMRSSGQFATTGSPFAHGPGGRPVVR